MAITAIAGIASAIGGAIAANVGALTLSAFAGTLFSSVGAAYFLLGAGLSMVSRALAPQPDLGAQMRGITQTTREPAGTRKIIYGRIRVGGNVVFISHSGTDNKYLHMAIVFATHEIQAYDEIWFNDNKIWTASGGFQGDWGTYVTIDRKFGTSGQSASTQLVNANSRWTTDHKLSGIAYIAFKLEWDQDKFPQGVPNITAVVRGKKVYDPRNQVTAYSQNPALCLRDYMMSEYGLDEIAANIDNTSVGDAADLCDEQVSLDGGGTQDRYQCNGVIDTANQIKANIEQLLSPMGGKLVYSGGKYFIDGAEYKTPTLTFTEADCISDIQTQTKQSRRGIYNGVKGIFVSEEKNYKVLDYPAQISSSYATEDGDPLYLDMPLPFVTNNLQAQRLAKIALLRSRQQTVMTMTVNLKGLQVKVGDTIQVTNDRLNYSNKVFEVVDYSLAINDGDTLGVNLVCIETASAIYDWTTSDEEDFLSGGELPLYDGRTVDNVTSLTVTEIGLRGPDGKVLSAVQLSWTAPDDAFIEYYTVRYNKNGTTDYFEVQTRETNALIEGLDITSNYDFRVKAQNLIGVRSSGTSLTNQALNGDTTAPSAPTGVTLTAGINQITCEWTNPTDIDYAMTEVHVSHQSGTPSISASPTAKITGEEYIATGLSQHTRFFHLRAVDFSGNKSAYTTQVSATALLATSDDIADDAVGSDQIADDAVGSDQIADGAVEITAFASGINPVQVVSTLPATAAQGDMAFLTTDNNLYRYDGSAWTRAIALGDVTGAGDLAALDTVGSSQIDNDAITNAKIAVDAITSDVIAAGAITTTTIADDAISTAKIAAGAITASEIAAGAITATEIAAGTITASEIASDTITANQIAAGAIAADEIAAGAVTTAKIAAGAVTANEIAADTITAGQIAAGAIGATEISVTNLAAINSDLGTLTAGTIDASAVTVSNLSATNITAGTLDADRISIDGVTLDTNASGQLIIADDGVSDDQVLSLDGSQTTITNLQVANLSGDVSEVFNLSVFVYPNHSVPEGASNADTFAEFTIPAPDSSLTKYASLNGKVKYIPSTSLDDCILVMQFERKSKGTSSGTLIGGVVGIVGSGTTGSPYTHYVEISGNHTKEIDAYGGIAQSQTSPSDVSKPKAVEYKSATNRTRIIYSGTQQSTPTYTTGSLYYNPDRWISSGSWLDDAAGAQRYPIPDVGSISTLLTLPLNQPLAKSSAAEDYRVRVNTLGRSSGTLNLSSIDSQIFLMT